LHRELGTPEKELTRRYFGALLHDVGKVAVSSKILTKASSLTDEEFTEMKSHPGVGAEVVRDIDHLQDLQWEILYHHERIDGKGYPHGLEAENIPYAARVLAVADTFDVLTNDRPYRQAMTKEEACEELKRVAGTQLDEEIVEVFVRAVEGGAAVVRFPVAVHTNDHVAEETFASKAR
jgi:HD-GYP domain-containing protein (c-di-GMP phosphodiesterase class II)